MDLNLLSSTRCVGIIFTVTIVFLARAVSSA